MVDKLMEFLNVYDRCTTSEDFFMEGLWTFFFFALGLVIAVFIIFAIVSMVSDFSCDMYYMHSDIKALERRLDALENARESPENGGALTGAKKTGKEKK